MKVAISRSLLVAAMLVASAGTASIGFAQTVNESIPGGVENRPSSDGLRGGAARSMSPPPAAATRGMPKPIAPPSAAAAAPVSAGAKATTEDANSGGSGGASGGKKKKSAPLKSAPPVMERAPAAEAPASSRGATMPRPIRPDESIPGGVERSPGNSQ